MKLRGGMLLLALLISCTGDAMAPASSPVPCGQPRITFRIRCAQPYTIWRLVVDDSAAMFSASGTGLIPWDVSAGAHIVHYSQWVTVPTTHSVLGGQDTLDVAGPLEFVVHCRQ